MTAEVKREPSPARIERALPEVTAASGLRDEGGWGWLKRVFEGRKKAGVVDDIEARRI